MSKQIDCLYEDPEIPSQKYSLISIVGPHMAQKCGVWGIKIRGCAPDLEKAKRLAKTLNEIDPNYDIYTVETGKFVPLVVEPDQVKSEYSNERLNELISGYLDSKEKSNVAWEKKKNQQIIDAKKQPAERTPEVIIHTIQTLKASIQEIEEKRVELLQSLDEYEQEFEKLSEEQRESALQNIQKVVDENQASGSGLKHI